MHKDHYENLYAVVRGEKWFTLLPPWDTHFTGIQPFAPAHYCQTPDGQWDVVREQGSPLPVQIVSRGSPCTARTRLPGGLRLLVHRQMCLF